MGRDVVREYGDAVAGVVVARAGAPDLGGAVAGLRAATDRPVHVVVADVAGAVGGAAVPDGVEVLRIAEDIGRGAAVNRAVAGLADHLGWIAVADPGVRWCPGALDVLLRAADRRPRAGVLGPLLREPTGAVVASAGPLPGLVDVLRGRAPTAPDGGPVGWVSARCLLLRRAAWDSVDGFDPRYIGTWDDVDLGDRLARAGWLSLHVPDAEVMLHPPEQQGILERRESGPRRYLRDRGPVAARILVGLAGRVHRR